MKRILRTIGALLAATALIIALIPVSDVEAVSTSDFQMEGSRLVKYAGTADIVTLPDDVRSIGEEAFAGNNTLVKVTINDKCKSIGYGAFSNCRSLRSVDVGNGVEDIGSAAFSNDAVLTSVNLGSNVKQLGSAVFAGDNALSNLTISSGNTHLVLDNDILYDDDYEKIYCALPTFDDGAYNMPNTVREIKGYAFWGNSSIKNVTLSSGLYAVPAYAFSNCSNLRQVTIPLPVRSIDSLAFENCATLSLVKCPDSLTYIADNAFNGCPNVTFSATTGSYADNYARALERTPVGEIEYEDVETAPVVTVTLPESIPEIPEDGINPDNTVSGNEIPNGDINNSQGEGTQGGAQGVAPDTASVTNSVNAQAKYKTGVINGADVVEYAYYDNSEEPAGMTIGSTIVAGGRALVFIDNKPNVINAIDLASNTGTQNNPENPEEINMDGLYTPDPNELDREDTRPLGDILSDSAQKGISFPKFTIAGDRIATQAYYGNGGLTEYDFPDGITGIGSFAFARSGLTHITIPEGVTDIGYGAFYHCDALTDISIPDSVTHISGYAFDNTPFLNDQTDTYVIIGDGVLIAYNGSDSIVTIPEGVKTIADGAFRDHMGITAVNFPDTLNIIGQDAFNGCRNLTTVNRGENVTEIGANAFKDTSLSNVTINENVKSIGLGAFDLNGGTDTVTFLGSELPELTSGDSARRLANTSDRTYAFGNMSNAIVPQGTGSLNGTVLEPGIYGFSGVVTDTYGNVISDNSNGVYKRTTDGGGISIDAVSGELSSNDISARIAGDESNYVLHISDSQNAKERISIAYGELYGGREPVNLKGFDIALYDDTDTVAITKLGKQTVDITMPLPQGMSVSNLHVVSLDEDGQLEAVGYTLSEDGQFLTFKCSHFSPYGLYNYTDNASDINYDGKTKIGTKDITPDTGDISIHPKWFLVIGCAALSAVMILLSMRRKPIFIK